MTMNPEIRDQWADALESGEYKQCKSALTRLAPDGSAEHCCLGVLTELAVKADVVTRVSVNGESVVTYENGSFGEASHLPIAVRDWAGLDSVNPSLRFAGDSFYATNLNDVEELTFPEIAALIRQQF